ncbi:hypothetical protein [Cellulomonas edaphi]|uniref:Uncharacterized protein n=1 Tax=Cellulomonas edaphi TaxID=3053468 RepID=A0ABT7SAF2_9CELL|nr:hypothetical protein [Cellulomons edaphi]MDM7832606.1 hypothetical protein [Cellulomons edaphi]
MAARASTREYDQFGPWIDEVRGPQDVPALYSDYPIDFAAGELVLKIPRNIARRDATPDMDLYDHLLLLRRDDFVVLSRTDPTAGGAPDGAPYGQRVLAFQDIAAIHDVVNLLDGRLSILARDGDVVSVAYNGAARASVDRLIDVLRAGLWTYPPAPTGELLAGAAPEAEGAAPLARHDGALMGDFESVARRFGGLKPWAWHDRQVVPPRGSGWRALARRLTHAMSPMTLHAAVLATDDVALDVFGRRGWLIRGKAPELSSARLVIPFGALENVRTAPHDEYHGVSEVTFGSGDARVSICVPQDSGALHGIERALVGVGRT